MIVEEIGMRDAMDNLLRQWGYDPKHSDEFNNYNTALKRIFELETELKVTKRLLDSALKLAFQGQNCDC